MFPHLQTKQHLENYNYCQSINFQKQMTPHKIVKSI